MPVQQFLFRTRLPATAECKSGNYFRIMKSIRGEATSLTSLTTSTGSVPSVAWLSPVMGGSHRVFGVIVGFLFGAWTVFGVFRRLLWVAAVSC